MEISAQVAGALGLLSDTLDDDAQPIEDSVRQLVAEARAIDSFVGVSVDLGPDLWFTTLVAATAPGEVRASVRIPLQATDAGLAQAPADIAVVLYASAPGAFVDLAADITWLARGPLDGLLVDRDLDRANEPDRMTMLQAMSATNQAVGALIGQGRNLADAEQEIRTRAADAAVPVETVAAWILAELDGRTVGESPDALA